MGRRWRARGLVVGPLVVSLLAAGGWSGGGAARAEDIGYHETCVSAPAGPQSWGYAGVNGRRAGCRLQVWESQAYAGAGAWRLEILRPGRHPGGEWLDRSGRVTTATSGRRSVAWTRIVLTSENARPACGSAIRRYDVIDARALEPGGALVIGSLPGGGDVENMTWALAMPGDHRDCLLPT